MHMLQRIWNDLNTYLSDRGPDRRAADLLYEERDYDEHPQRQVSGEPMIIRSHSRSGRVTNYPRAAMDHLSRLCIGPTLRRWRWDAINKPSFGREAGFAEPPNLRWRERLLKED